MATGKLISCTGFAAYLFVRGQLAVMAVTVAISAGQATFWTGTRALIGEVARSAERRFWFALRPGPAGRARGLRHWRLAPGRLDRWPGRPVRRPAGFDTAAEMLPWRRSRPGHARPSRRSSIAGTAATRKRYLNVPLTKRRPLAVLTSTAKGRLVAVSAIVTANQSPAGHGLDDRTFLKLLKRNDGWPLAAG